jgi:hypothetical protein
LEQRGTASLRALREERFSLRLIAEAEKAGHVHIDLLTGIVTCRIVARPEGAVQHKPPTAA